MSLTLMENFADFQDGVDTGIGDNFTDFGVNRKRQIERSTNDDQPFAIKDFLSLPHFDDSNNCFQLIAALKSNDKIVVQKVNEENIYVYEVNASGASIKYGELDVQFDKFDLIKRLEEKCSMQESKKVKKVKKTNKVKSDSSDSDFSSNAIKKFKEMFNVNRVEQLDHLKSSDEYKNEHAKGDIYKIQ